MRHAVLFGVLVTATVLAQQPNPRQQPNAPITVFAPEQHDLYDGQFVISANRIYMVGSLNDPPGWLVVDRFNEFSPCQNGGLVAYLHEHGTDSGCGDNSWPKTFVFLAGWGYGHATLNGRPLYQDYEMHFMVTQGIRDRKTLRVSYPMANKKGAAGEVNPATQQIDFYIRSPQQNPRNRPNREVFAHFFGMESTWK